MVYYLFGNKYRYMLMIVVDGNGMIYYLGKNCWSLGLGFNYLFIFFVIEFVNFVE